MKNFNRVGVKIRLGELGAYALQGFDLLDARGEVDIPVGYTWDAAAVYGPTLFLGLITGAARPTGSLRASGAYKDEFTVHADLLLSGYGDPRLAERAAEAGLQAITRLVIQSPHLANPAVTASDEATTDASVTAYIGAVTGPFHTVDSPGSSTVAGVVGVDFTCTTTITGAGTP